MTISTTTTTVTYQGNNATTVWSFPFVSDSHIEVYYTDTLGEVFHLDPATYILTFNAVPAGGLWSIGGFVTYPITGSPIATGTSITITRDVPYTQDVSISNQGSFYPQVVEQGLDVLELQVQQVNTDSSYSLKFPFEDGVLPDVLPTAVQRAQKILGFDGNGQPVMVYNNDVTITIDTITQPVLNVLATPPVSPTNGSLYLVAHSGTTGAFVGHEDQLALWNNAWEFTTQPENVEVLNLANSAVYHRTLMGWAIKQVYAVPGDDLQARADTASGGTLVFLPGTYTSVNILFSSNTTITSTGLVTLQTTSNTNPIWDFSNTSDCIVRGRFVLQGNGANATINGTGVTGLVNNGQVGIKTFDTLRLDIDGDIEITNISGYGIDEQAPDNSFRLPWSCVFKGLRIHDTYFGTYVRNFSEYSSYIGCSFYNCVAGIKDEAGNRSYVDCIITNNNYGVFLDGTVEPGNNSHGIVSGCLINHNGISGGVGASIYCDSTQLGMLFSGCQILADLNGAGHGLIRVLGGSKLIAFTGCDIGADVGIDGTSQAIFTGNTIRSDLANPPVVDSGGEIQGTGNVSDSNITAFFWNNMTSWTPVLQFGGSSTGITYSFQNARYRIGDGYLYFTAKLVLTSKGSSTGVATVTGLPLIVGPISADAVCTATGGNLQASVTDLKAIIPTSSSSINLYNFDVGGLTQLTDTSFTNNSIIYISGFYPLG